MSPQAAGVGDDHWNAECACLQRNKSKRFVQTRYHDDVGRRLKTEQPAAGSQPVKVIRSASISALAWETSSIRRCPSPR